MKRGVSIKPFQFFAILVLATLTSQVSAQLPGGGGGVNSNPYNPQNWNCDYEVTYNGTTTYKGFRYQNQSLQEYTQVYTWGTPIGPYDDAAYNESFDFRNIEALATGTISKRIKWIGVGPAPGVALVKVSAHVEVF